MLLTGKGWKRMVTKVCYVGEGFTRKPPKFERFIRPMVSQLPSVNLNGLTNLDRHQCSTVTNQ